MAFGLALEGFRPVPKFNSLASCLKYLTKLLVKWHVHVTVWVVLVTYLLLSARLLVVVYIHREMHADNLEGLIAQSHGIRVVIPSNPYDAKGLLISAIRDNDPVVFLEHMKLYRSFREEVPKESTQFL